VLLSLLCFWLICAFWKNLISRTPPTTIGDRDGRQISRERRESCGAQKTKKGKKQKKKKRKKRKKIPCTQKLFSLIKSLRDLLYIFPPRTQSTNERFFSFDIALFADSTTECVCVREKEVSSTHGQLKRARSKSTRKDYLNKNLEKKAKAD